MSNNLFSHAPEPDYVAAVESARRQESVVLGVPVEHAFDGFTDGAHLWWPVDTESTFGEGSHVAFLRDHLVEESLEGDELIWAEVADWESPTLVKLEWTLGVDPGSPLDIEIHFEAASPETCRVTIEFDHTEEAVDDGHTGFVCDWSLILARYARFMGGAVSLD